MRPKMSASRVRMWTTRQACARGGPAPSYDFAGSGGPSSAESGPGSITFRPRSTCVGPESPKCDQVRSDIGPNIDRLRPSWDWNCSGRDSVARTWPRLGRIKAARGGGRPKLFRVRTIGLRWGGNCSVAKAVFGAIITHCESGQAKSVVATILRRLRATGTMLKGWQHLTKGFFRGRSTQRRTYVNS